MNSSIIGLLTDFGISDTYVGSMKAAIYQVAPKATIVDICHHISPQNVLEAAFVLRTVMHDYPAGMIFVAVVDPEVGTARKALLMTAGDYYFIGPDNGIFSYPYTEETVGDVISLENENFFRRPTSATFHGRDIFGPCAGLLSQGTEPIAFGPLLKDKPKLLQIPYPVYDEADRTLTGQVMRSDRFGNLITNIHRSDVEQIGWDKQTNDKVIEIVDWTIPVTSQYAHDKEDPLCALWGSANFLEIAARQASAYEILDIMPAEPAKLRVV